MSPYVFQSVCRDGSIDVFSLSHSVILSLWMISVGGNYDLAFKYHRVQSLIVLLKMSSCVPGLSSKQGTL